FYYTLSLHDALPIFWILSFIYRAKNVHNQLITFSYISHSFNIFFPTELQYALGREKYVERVRDIVKGNKLVMDIFRSVVKRKNQKQYSEKQEQKRET